MSDETDAAEDTQQDAEHNKSNDEKHEKNETPEKAMATATIKTPVSPAKNR